MIELINLFSYSFLSALIGQAPSIPICFMFVQPACFVHLELQCCTLRIDESIINFQCHECVKWSKAWLVQTNLSLRTRVILCGDVSLVILAREKEKKIHFMRKEYDFSLESKKKKNMKSTDYIPHFSSSFSWGKNWKITNTCHKKVILLSRALWLNWLIFFGIFNESI